MNPFEAIIRAAAEKAENEKRFGHLTREQRIEKNQECNRLFWEHITFNTLSDGDELGRMMQQLIVTLRDADLAQYHRDHLLVDEDEAPRKESKLRCKFWDEHRYMILAAVNYAKYCGYITADNDAMDKAIGEIEAKYEAMKPSDNEQQ